MSNGTSCGKINGRRAAEGDVRHVSMLTSSSWEKHAAHVLIRASLTSAGQDKSIGNSEAVLVSHEAKSTSFT